MRKISFKSKHTKEKKNKNPGGRKHLYGLMILITVLFAVCGVFLPGRLLRIQSDAELDGVSAVPDEYNLEVSAAMARNASANLNTYERLQLISGKWSSTLSDANSYEMETQDYEAIAQARDGLNVLYENHLYPESVSSEYGSWYTWEATPYKAVDSTFHTYTAYFWKITFCKYNGLENHQVYLLEDGTIFYAIANYGTLRNMDTVQRVRDYYQQIDKDVIVLNFNHKLISSYVPYAGSQTTKMEWMDLVEYPEGDNTYFVVQACTDKSYLYSIAP